MKSYKEITGKYLKHNKKRSILTICGIILSVALITSIGLFIKSMQNTFLQEAISENGSYHISIYKEDNEVYDKIHNNPKIDKVGLKESVGDVYLRDEKKINITKFNENALRLLPYKAIKGELPKKHDEIALESWILSYMDGTPNVGSIIKIKLNNREEKEFKITGLIKNNSSSQLEGRGLGIVYSDKFNINNSIIYATISEKADISDTISELKGNFKEFKSNEEVLRLMGEGQNENINKSLYQIASIIIGVVVIATIAVIYNSFQISVVERIKQFGLLRAVGATQKQIKKIVLREATLISSIGIPLGLFFGVIALKIVAEIFKMMSSSAFGNLNVVISYKILAISALVGLFSIYISALIPARFAGKISPLVAISSRALIVKEKIKKNRGRIAKKILGINGLMAFKNIKRNKKRFNITVFSITISVTLFIFFTTFINMLNFFNTPETESDISQFSVVGTVDNKGKSSLNKNIIDQIKNNNYTNDVFVHYINYSSKSVISIDKKEPNLEKVAPDIYEKIDLDGKEMIKLGVAFDAYDENKLKNSSKYVVSGKIDIDKMKKENGVILVKNQLIADKGGHYNGSFTKLKVGDSFYVNKNILRDDLIGKNNEKENKLNFNKEDMVKVKVVAIVNTPPYGFFVNPEHLKIITTKDVLGNIAGKDMNKILLDQIQSAEIDLKDKGAGDEFQKWIQPLGDRFGIRVINHVQQMEEQKSSGLQIKILMYGFIVVVSLIGAVNIINTITTNLILRKKEIASLSAIGMTYKNIKRMILTEGILYGVYGSIYGVIVGTFLSYAMFSNMTNIMKFKWPIPWQSICIAVGTSIFIGLISVIRPLNMIKKSNIIDVIKAEE
ncbi:ABC transporter permease [Clostridium tetani]|uniref:ABC transporter ATP-binding protein n=1 Tax=Clostridium tetani (strain Massachusetts / E88) TaxID=212717 RepID=Q893J8_CLOTE|nr:FtsX-like permease family protein [Clostridium tetani]AAO36344.1 ABC transporter ATP-binding protein [Clostridium tetani E88]KGI37692.1 permease [Clostridium tetani]KGI44941.1 permease [Clostridium tetani]KGI45587.1 permease [Clostridium tetani]KHO31878.1 permease [Clostridium tetani]